MRRAPNARRGALTGRNRLVLRAATGPPSQPTVPNRTDRPMATGPRSLLTVRSPPTVQRRTSPGMARGRANQPTKPGRTGPPTARAAASPPMATGQASPRPVTGPANRRTGTAQVASRTQATARSAPIRPRTGRRRPSGGDLRARPSPRAATATASPGSSPNPAVRARTGRASRRDPAGRAAVRRRVRDRKAAARARTVPQALHRARARALSRDRRRGVADATTQCHSPFTGIGAFRAPVVCANLISGWGRDDSWRITVCG